eukprot:m51a1_g8454 hypothetical protein (739) ;mRNA; r:406705-409478
MTDAVVLLSLLLLACLSAADTQRGTAVASGGVWGAWGPWEHCSGPMLAAGLSTKSQAAQGSAADDTAANALRLHCRSPSAPDAAPVPGPVSSEGPLGSWDEPLLCPAQAYVAGFRLRRERPQGKGDDTAVNQAMILCRALGSSQLLGPYGPAGKTAWGEWTEDVVCPDGTYASGLQTQLEAPGTGDDTALNGLALDCVAAALPSQSVLEFAGAVGDWGVWDQCEGHAAGVGLQTLSEGPQGKGDDTALNGLQMACSDLGTGLPGLYRPHSSVGPWGTWDQPHSCPSGYYIVGFKVLNEHCCDRKDDTALNRIVFICRSGDRQTAYSPELGKTSWGDWSQEYVCPQGQVVTAIQTRLEARQGSGDDTALNGIRMRCQSVQDSCGGCFNGGRCNEAAARCECIASFAGANCEIDTSRRLSFNNNRKFKIVQFTDMHYRVDSENDKTDAVQATVLQAEHPDLIVYTGDLMSGTSIKAKSNAINNWKRATSVAARGNYKWARLFGNHDDDGPLNRQEMFTMDAQLPGSLTTSGPADLFGESNYYLPIYKSVAASEQTPASLLWFLGVSDRSCEGVGGDGCVTRSQVDWFQSSSSTLASRWQMTQNPFSLMFFHIPVPEYVTLWNTATVMGSKNEKVCCPKTNTGLYEAAYNAGVRGMFVGHDHVNDFCGTLPGKPLLMMCYGRKTGYGYYNPEAPMYHGARVVELTLGPSGDVTMDTWIRDERGSRIDLAPHTPTAGGQTSC